MGAPGSSDVLLPCPKFKPGAALPVGVMFGSAEAVYVGEPGSAIEGMIGSGTTGTAEAAAMFAVREIRWDNWIELLAVMEGETTEVVVEATAN